MNAQLESIIQPLNDFWNRLSRTNKIVITLVAALVLLAIVATSIFMGRAEYDVLFTGLDPADAGEIIKRLDEMKVEHTEEGTGMIYVKKGTADTLRMQFASEGLPSKGMDYDIFSRAQGMTVTDFEKYKYWQIQVQQRLSATIASLDRVREAIVTINIPQPGTTVLSSNDYPASASVLVNLVPGTELSVQQIRAIEQLVMKSVPGLTRDNLTIIDTNMNELNSPDNRSTVDMANSQFQLEQDVKDGLKKQLLTLLEPVYGIGNVLPGVNVRLNFDRANSESIVFQPVTEDGEGIAASLSTLREEMTNMTNADNVGLDPNGAAPNYPGVVAGNGTYSKATETVNYEVNQLREQIERQQGNVTDLSVSVLVNQEQMEDDARERLTAIVASALGIDTNRVVVQNMVFEGTNQTRALLDAARQQVEDARQMEAFRNNLIIWLTILVVLALLGFALFTQLKRKREAEQEAEDLLLREMQAQATQAALQASQIDMEHKNEYMEQILEFLDRNPESVAHLMRNWISEEDLDGY